MFDDIEKLREQVDLLTKANEELREKNVVLSNKINFLEHNSIDLVSIVEQSLFAIIISDGGKFLYVNQAFEYITGYSVDKAMQLVDYQYLQYIHPDDREIARQFIFNREKDEKAEARYNFKFRFLVSTGEYRCLESWSRRIQYHGQMVSLSTLLDVTEKEQVLEDLKTNKTKYKTIFEHSPIGIYYSNLKGEMVEVNETTVKILGSPSKEATQKINLFTFPLLVEAGFSDRLRECIETGKSIIADTNYVTKWDKRVWIRYYLNPIYKNNVINGALINFVDITEAKSAEFALKQNEIELLAAKERAEESNRLKTSFLENMNHEIRTPLNGILGFLDLCKESDISLAERNEYMNIIDDCASQLLAIISDILEASSLSSGKLSVNIKAFSPQKMIEHLGFYFEQEKNKKINKTKQSIVISTNCDLMLGLQVLADQEKIQQILVNLLNNALKFTHQGTIELGCTYQSDSVLLFYVKDTGIGIDPSKHQIIFERFRQADESLVRNYGGTGLGLAICKSLVELMGGRIWVESTPNEGSCFCFTLPYESCDEVEIKIEPIKDQINNVKGTVLLVDDVYIIGEYCKRLVKNTEIKLHYVTTGYQAIELCKQQKFDLILMDLQMPHIDGYETLRIMREQNITTPAVAVTAQVLTSTVDKVREAGFARHLSKPFKQTEFMQLLTECL